MDKGTGSVPITSEAFDENFVWSLRLLLIAGLRDEEAREIAAQVAEDMKASREQTRQFFNR